MAQPRTNNALQIIFSFFLGLMVLAFIGIGVNTFYPSPSQQNQEKIQELYRDQERLNMKTNGGKALTEAEEAEAERISKQIEALEKENRGDEQIWARNTSIVLILFATLVMVISLIRSEELRVISNGLLLGGLFSMVYGVGWVIFSGESTARFVVIVFAFAVTLALGYLKFVRERSSAPVAAPAGAGSSVALDAAGSDAVAALDRRISALESRLGAVAAALGDERTER